MGELTNEEHRVLDHLASHEQWSPIIDLHLLWSMGSDDDLFVPGLAAKGLIEHDAVARAVRLTPAGRAALEPRDER